MSDDQEVGKIKEFSIFRLKDDQYSDFPGSMFVIQVPFPGSKKSCIYSSETN